MWNARVLLRYWLLQLPGTAAVVLVVLVLRGVLDLPAWVPWAIVAAWIAKDALLYGLVWRSYDTQGPTAHSIEGELGIALERIDPTGYVRLRGERWRAQLASDSRPVEKGETVRVESVRDLTLIVRPSPR